MALFVIVLIVSAAGWFMWRMEVTRRETQHERDTCESYLARAESDPENVGAREAMGDWMVRHNRLHDAVRAYEDAIQIEQRQDSDIRGEGRLAYKLAAVNRDIESSAHNGLRERVRNSGPRSWDIELCTICGASNEPGTVNCEYCGEPLPAKTMREALQRLWENRKSRMAMIQTLIIVAVLFIAIMFASSLSMEAEAVLICSTVIVLGFLFIQSFNGNRG